MLMPVKMTFNLIEDQGRVFNILQDRAFVAQQVTIVSRMPTPFRKLSL